MPPQTQNNQTETVTKADAQAQSSWYFPLFQVTKTSKIITAIIFIAMPFLGGYVGWKFHSVDEQVDTATIIKNANTVIDVSGYSSDELDRFIQLKTDFDNKLKMEHLTNEVESQLGSRTTSIRYGTFDDLWGYFEDETVPMKVLENITIPSNLAYLQNIPFLTLVASSTDALFFTRNCFVGKACSYAGLYKLTTETNTLSEMQVSKFFDMAQLGSDVLATNSQYVVTLSSYDLNPSLLVLDLYSDTVITLENQKSDDAELFCAPGMGCDLDFTPTSQRSILFTKYLVTDEFNQSADTNLLSTTTVEYSW